ncbi:MAG: G5 domain-containing protein [Clostridia bacterium]|nr:G5 domain-containing protein [Clostridia bacterium]
MIEKLKSGFQKLWTRSSGRKRALIALSLASVLLFSVLALSVNTVSVTADGQRVVTLKTMLSDTDSILELANISYGDDDLVTTKEQFGKMDIAVKYSFPVYITLGKNTTTVTTTGATVGELLDMANIMVSENDIVNYDLDTKISATTYIDVIDIDYITETYTKRIYYQAKTVKDKNLPEGRRIETGGIEGTKQVTCKKTIVNGVVTEEQIIDEVVLTEAVDKVITIGTKKVADPVKDSVTAGTVTKPPKVPNNAVTDSSKVKSVSVLKPSSPIPLDSNGNPVNYTKRLTVQATAYLAKGTCATGVSCKPGCIAVNPNYIPYGTKMYIKSSDGKYVYGYAIAADTGGFIRTKPTNVDLAFPTNAACLNFGRRNVEIYILE